MGATTGTTGVQAGDPYVAGLVQGVRPEEQRQVLRREMERLTRESQAHDGVINQRRAEGYGDEHPKIQGWLKLTRGTDAEYRRNGGKPLPGTLNDRVQRIQAELGEPVGRPTPPAAKPVLGAQPRKPLGGTTAPGKPAPTPEKPTRPLELDGDVSAAPTGYVQRVLQGVAPGGQAARLRTELDQLTRESARLQKKINELLATDVPASDPRVQVLLRRIRGTDKDLRTRNGAPVPNSLNDRADQVRVALEPPRAGELRRPTPQEEHRLNLQKPGPTPEQVWLSGLGPHVQRAADVKFSMMDAGRKADLASAQKVEQEADAAAKLPRPGTRDFGKLTPAAAVLERFFPTGTQYGAAQVDRIVGTPEFQRARQAAPPETQQYVDRMVARLRARDGRSADPNTGTAEAAGLVADVAVDKLFGLAGDWLRGISRAKAVAKYGVETVAEAEKRGLLASARAGAKTLAQDTRIRARLGMAPGAVSMAGNNVLNEVVTGDPKKDAWQRTKDVLWATGTGLVEGAAGGGVSETLAPLRGKTAASLVRAGQEVARGGLNFGVVEPLGALVAGERDPKKLLDHLVGGLLFGGALQTLDAGKALRTKPVPEGPELKPGDRVRVTTKPELGTATVREVKDGHAVLRLDQKQGQTSTVKAHVGQVEHLQPTPKTPGTAEATRQGADRERGPMQPGKGGPAEEVQAGREREKQPGLPEQTPQGRSPEPGERHGESPEALRPAMETLPERGRAPGERPGMEAERRRATPGGEEGRPAEVDRRERAQQPGDAVRPEESARRPATKDAMDLHAARQSGDAEAKARLKQGWDEPRQREAELRLRELHEEGGRRAPGPDRDDTRRRSEEAEARVQPEEEPVRVRPEEEPARVRPEDREARRGPEEEPRRERRDPEPGETTAFRAGLGTGSAPEVTPRGTPRTGGDVAAGSPAGGPATAPSERMPSGEAPGQRGRPAEPEAAPWGTPQSGGDLVSGTTTGGPAAGAPGDRIPNRETPERGGLPAEPGDPRQAPPPPPRSGEPAPAGAPPGVATPERTPLPTEGTSPAPTPTTAPEMTSGAVVVSGSREGPGSPARPGPSLADHLAPGHSGVVWHATGATAALELVAGRNRGSGLEVADRLALAKGPGGRSVVLELDPTRLQGKAGPARGRPGRNYAVTGVEPEAVRALVGTPQALARFAADPAVAARFDFAQPVETARGWRVERRGPVATRRPLEANPALRQEVMKQLWRPLTEPELRGQVRRKLPPAGVPEVLAELVREGAVSVEHRDGKPVYRAIPEAARPTAAVATGVNPSYAYASAANGGGTGGGGRGPEAPGGGGEPGDALPPGGGGGGKPPTGGGDKPPSGGNGGSEPPWKPQYPGGSGEEWERQVRKQREPWLQEMAAKHEITPQQYEVKVAEHLSILLSKMTPFRRFDEETLVAMLKGERLKSLFETGTSSGAYVPQRRAKAEHTLWGIPKNDRRIVRPSYGYLHPNTEGRVSDDEPWDYGQIAVRFKREILERTTFTVGDSLDQVTVPDALDQARKPLRPRFAPRPVHDPSWVAVPLPMGDPLDYPNAEAFTQATLATFPVLHYVEAQYHDAVTLADVEAVIFLQESPSEEIRHLLKTYGIPFEVRRRNRKGQ